MDKKIFILDKYSCRKELVENLSEKDLEEWWAEEGDYDDEHILIQKINANSYHNVEEALENEAPFVNEEDCYIFSFGF